MMLFQLTAPLREPTWTTSSVDSIQTVSTHGSLAGADFVRVVILETTNVFQLTAPLREPTSKLSYVFTVDDVSTHGSLAGADNAFSMTSYAYSVSTHGSLAGADYE